MTPDAATTAPDIDSPYPLSPRAIQRFREDGHVKLKNVLSPEAIAWYEAAVTRVAMEHNPNRDKPLEQRDTYGKAFIQVSNIWTIDPVVKAFSFSKRLARLAAELLGCPGVRMWHDQALYKEAGGGFTPWHVDQQYWPMSSGLSVTAWIPLQATPMEMGPLCFGRGSHLKNIGRDLEISDESERLIRQAVKQQGVLQDYEPFDLGEVSFHYGWTLHRAGPNTTGRMRKVHTIIYMDQDMRLAEPKNENQRCDWRKWTPSTQVGEVMDDALNPVLYSRTSVSGA
jgi:ectoine hydroxylase-related dioxygenase (phytanoyl-CoA dioxygenase family)